MPHRLLAIALPLFALSGCHLFAATPPCLEDNDCPPTQHCNAAQACVAAPAGEGEGEGVAGEGEGAEGEGDVGEGEGEGGEGEGEGGEGEGEGEGAGEGEGEGEGEGGDGACGDGIVDANEECDDGNTTDGDGCSAGCQIESGQTCAGTPSACFGVGDASHPTTGQDLVSDAADTGIDVIELDGSTTYTVTGGGVNLDNGRVVTIVGRGTSRAIIKRTSNGKLIDVHHGSQLRLIHVQLEGTGNVEGIDVHDAGSSVVVEDSVIGPISGTGGGILAEIGSSITVVRTRVKGIGDDGLIVETADFQLANDMLFNNGGAGVVFSEPPAGTSRVAHVTTSGNGAGGVTCTGTSVDVSFSILFGDGGTELSGCGSVATQTLVGSPNPNFLAGGTDDDLHLAAASPAIGAADQSTEILDIDGQRRTTPRDAGADEFVP